MRPLDSQVVTQQSLSVPGQSVCQTVVIRVPEGWDQDFGLRLASSVTPSAKQLKGVLQGEQFLRRTCTSGRNGRRIWRPFAAALCSLHTHARQRPNSNPRPPHRRQVRAQRGVWRPIGTSRATLSDAKLGPRLRALWILVAKNLLTLGIR